MSATGIESKGDAFKIQLQDDRREKAQKKMVVNSKTSELFGPE
jgi:hypothetical protein